MSSDDIVGRLRLGDIDIVERLRYGDNTLTTAEVIAEIERLRAAGDALAVFVRRFGDVDNWTQQGSFIFDDRLLSAVVEWQEARRER